MPPAPARAAADLAAARRFCVAPMMRYSHRHARQFWRILCPPALLHTEMLTAEAVIHGDSRRLLRLPPRQGPVALQLGGGDPGQVARAAAIGEAAGYAEINLNCGCPSARVRQRDIGACLMAHPRRVAAIVAATKLAVAVPVTVKCRLAIDSTNAESDLDDFVRIVADAGCDAFIVHARRAWLNGVNPAQNRRLPPLDLPRVRRLKESFPRLLFVVNGGLQTVDAAAAEAPFVDGVMLGRAVCRRPYLLADAGWRFFGVPPISRRAALTAMLEYVQSLPPTEWRRALTPLAGLRHGEANGKLYRRCLAMAPDEALRLLPQWA